MKNTGWLSSKSAKPPAPKSQNIDILLERIKEKTVAKDFNKERRGVAWDYNLSKEGERIYDAKERALQEEVEKLLKELREGITQLKKATKTLSKETERTVSQTIPNPGRYHINFLRRIRDFILGLIKNINQSNEWLTHWNQYQKRKGHFWATFTAKKKGGSKFLLSSEHYLTRSAG